MTGKEKRIQALKNLKTNMENMIRQEQLTSNNQIIIDELLDHISRLMPEIEELEKSIRN